jgi:hypothetical protein
MAIYQRLEKEISEETKLIAKGIDLLGTYFHWPAKVQLRSLGWKVECWELVGKTWRKTS